MNIGQIGEDVLIEQFIDPIASKIGDDCGSVPGSAIITSVDSQVEQTHFLRRFPAHGVGFKSVASALSDLTACGATPSGMLLALHLPEDLNLTWFEKFLNGVREASEAFICPLIGGNIARSEKIVITTTVFGEPIRKKIERWGAKPKDDIWVSGNPGISQAGLHLLLEGKTEESHPWIRRHLYPPNRQTFLLELLNKTTPSAMLDLSDGLVKDCTRLNNRHGQAQILLDKLTAPKDLKSEPFWIGGEDYELLFCSPKNERRNIEEAASKSQTPIIRIGSFVVAGPTFLFNGEPYTFRTKGFQHY